MFLTKRQKEVLDYLKGYVSQNGYAPTFNEIAVEFGFSSKGTVYKHIKALREKGLIHHEWNKTRAIEIPKDSGSLSNLPVLGTVAAGIPIEAIENPESLDVPSSFLRRGEHYVLKVSGDSMIDEHIADGDYIIVKKRGSAENGETVIALVDNNEVTIKRYYHRGSEVELRPANELMEALVLDPDRVQIRGVVVGVMRKY
ncbi:MAG: transcriptional repressor LexA [Fidelibacterota bacterium]